jgi:hypothetical protein
MDQIGETSQVYPPLNFRALSTVISPDGRRHTIQVIPPGEPSTHVFAFAVLAYISHPLTSSNQLWVVLVARQRGPWRKLDKIHSASFIEGAEAVRHQQLLLELIETGQQLPPAAS